MIAFGCSVTREDEYRRCAQRGIELVAAPEDRVLALSAAGSIFAGYNRILDQAAQLEGLEALVLVHQDSEIVDPAFCAKVRDIFADPDVGVIGCIGALGVRSIAWWEGSITWASFIHRFSDQAGGDLPSLTWDAVPAYGHVGQVDTVDGFLLVLSPWVVRNVRFDGSLGEALHGYDFDFCLQVREAGRTIRSADLKMVHHHSLALAGDLEGWSRAHVKVAEKWHGRMGKVGWAPGDWRQRARRAEAEAALTRSRAIAAALQSQARTTANEREATVMTTSAAWRLTAPWRRAAPSR